MSESEKLNLTLTIPSEPILEVLKDEIKYMQKSSPKLWNCVGKGSLTKTVIH